MANHVIEQFLQQQQQFMQEQSKLWTQVLTYVANKEPPKENPWVNKPDTLLESLANSITEFQFDVDNGKTFANWFARYEDVFKVDCKDIDDATNTPTLSTQTIFYPNTLETIHLRRPLKF